MSSQWILYLMFIVFLLVLVSFYSALHYIAMAHVQQLLVLLFSGFLQVFAGYLLFRAHSTGDIGKIPGLLALIPTFMDLKGNLEVSMACRISTTANTSNHMRHMAGIGKVMWDNVLLIQCQVTIISVFAVAVTAAFVYLTGEESFSWNQTLVLLAIGLSASSLTCTVLGSLVTLVISMLVRVGIDPDDMASSIAASTGDLITIFLFSLMSSQLSSWAPETAQKFCWISSSIILGLFPILLYLVLSDPVNRSKMKNSLLALLFGTIISLISGFIFESMTKDFNQITLIQSMYTGFVGNCISIITSLLTTHFQRVESDESSNLVGGKSHLKWFVGPKEVFHTYELNPKISMTCRSHLLHVILPCQFAYLLAIRTFLGDQYLRMTTIFVVFYMFSSFILLTIMIYITCNLVHVAVKLNWDADETVIPINTSTTDLCGSILLAIFYHILRANGDLNAQIG